jgi:hypothetical protein
MRFLYIVGLCVTLNNIKYLALHSSVLWGINVTINNKTYLVLHVKRQIFLTDINQAWITSTGLHKTSQNQTSWKSVQWGHADTYDHDEANTRLKGLCQQANFTFSCGVQNKQRLIT